MLKPAVTALIFLLAASDALADPHSQRPVGDDSTDLAPLDQRSKPLPAENTPGIGNASQGAGTANPHEMGAVDSDKAKKMGQ